MRQIEDSDELTPGEKKAQLNASQRDINFLYKQAVDQVREAKKEKKKGT